MSAPAPTIKGLTAIIWGTDNAVASPAGAIVESLNVSPKNGKPIEIEDNNGFAAVEILLVDGFDADATFVYDANKAWPKEGDNVTLSIPKTNGNGRSNFVCLVASFAPDMARKQEAKLKMTVTYRPGVDV